MVLIDRVSRIVYCAVSLVLMLLAAAVIGYAAFQIGESLVGDNLDARTALLTGVGYTIIAVAIFDVAKYLLEEEVLRGREMRHAGEARRSLTKFLSTITIAVFLEAIVAIFSAAGAEASKVLAAVALLFGGIALIVGFGVYLRLSAAAEKEIGGAQGEVKDEAQSEAAHDQRKAAG
jgi:hypothetical protein